LLDLLFQFRAQLRSNLVDASGMQVIYVDNPGSSPSARWASQTFGQSLASLEPASKADNPLSSILINGEPIDDARSYKTAIGGGILEAFKFVNGYFPNAVPMDQVVDTGLEDWRVVLDYIHAMPAVTRDRIQFGNRIQSQKADFGIVSDDISWE